MTDKVEMSLDDIIAQEPRKYGRRNWSNGGNSRRGETNNVPRRGRGTTTRGTVGVFRNRRGFGNNNLRSAPYSRQSGGGDINARWQHDMYDGPYGAKRSAPISGGTTKLLVSNLDFGVSNSDIQELFTEFGPLKSATVHYDKSGRSLGTADVVFDRRADAVKAIKQYNGIPLDGRPMNIEMALGSMAILQGGGQLGVGGNRFNQQPRPLLRMGGGGNPRGRGMRGRGGRGRGSFRGRGRSSGPPPTAEELDAELDAYVNKLK